MHFKRFFNQMFVNSEQEKQNDISCNKKLCVVLPGTSNYV